MTRRGLTVRCLSIGALPWKPVIYSLLNLIKNLPMNFSKILSFSFNSFVACLSVNISWMYWSVLSKFGKSRMNTFFLLREISTRYTC